MDGVAPVRIVLKEMVKKDWYSVLVSDEKKQGLFSNFTTIGGC